MFNFLNKKKEPKQTFTYGDFVKIKDDFYKDCIGQVCAKSDNKYLIKLRGSDPVYNNLELSKENLWIKEKNLEKLDIEIEKVKEDFWHSIKPKEQDRKSYSIQTVFGTPASQINPLKKNALTANAISKLTNKKVVYDSTTDSFTVTETEDV